MKRLLLMATVLALATSCSAQNKVKGDGDVISVNGTLKTGINTIEIGDDFELELVQSNSNDYILTTDRNLTTVIDFQVRDSVLIIRPTTKITRSKDLKVYLKLQNPQHVILKGNADLESNGMIDVPHFTLTASESSRFDFKLKSEKVRLNLSGNAEGESVISTADLDIKMIDRTELKGDFDASETIISLSDNAEFRAKGKTDDLKLTSADKADYKGRDFEADDASVTLSGRTATEIYSKSNLTVYAQDKASIESYGKGEISMNALKDDASIEKK